MHFSEEKVSEIIEKNDIVDVLSDYLTLKKSGSNYMALCPFHSEKTPSFSVSRNKQIFNCFGCGVGGNVVTFVQKIERLNYVEALKLLAERAKIHIEADDGKDLEKSNEKNLIFKINRETALFFHNRLLENSKALKYLNGRGLSESIIKKFGIGFAQDAWRDLLDYLVSKGYKRELIFKAGLIVQNKDNTGYFDKFRNRIMFPIIDLKGNVLAFGGRVMDDSKPKYLNSPETPVFSKGSNIYALNFVKKQQNLQNIIMVEGYMDVIALHQYGVENAAASLGTAFTENQAKLLKRFCEEVIIAYDSDLAGQAATVKGLSILEKEGCRVKVLSLPSGKDPDEYIRKEGLDAFKDRVTKSLSLIEYKIENAKRGLNTEKLEDRITFSKALANILKDVESNVEVDAYIKKYSNIIGSREEAIYAELKRLKGDIKFVSNKNSSIDNNKFTNPEIIAERALLNLAIRDKSIAEKIFNELTPQDFSGKMHLNIANIINLKIKEGKTITAGEIITYFNNEDEKSKVAEIFSTELPEEITDIMLFTNINSIKKYKINLRIQELTEKMQMYYHQEGMKEKANEIFIEIQTLQRKIK